MIGRGGIPLPGAVVIVRPGAGPLILTLRANEDAGQLVRGVIAGGGPNGDVQLGLGGLVAQANAPFVLFHGLVLLRFDGDEVFRLDSDVRHDLTDGQAGLGLEAADYFLRLRGEADRADALHGPPTSFEHNGVFAFAHGVVLNCPPSQGQ